MTDYARPPTLTDALALMAGGQARVLAGGTDLYPGAGSGLAGPIVDLGNLAELSGLRRDAGLWIGAATSWTAIAEADLPPACRALQQAARQVGGRQVQNAGTIGGNLCNASPAADSVPALIAAGATAVLVSAGPGGALHRREIPVEALPQGPGRTALAAGELLEAIRLPAPPARAGDAYLRLIPRSEMDIAVAGCGVALGLDADGRIASARVALGAVAPTALLVPAAAEAIVGSTLDEAACRRLEEAARAASRPIDDKRGTASYRTRVAGVLARRAALVAFERARTTRQRTGMEDAR